MMTKKEYTNIFEKFIDSTLIESRALKTGNYRLGNKHSKIIIKILKTIEKDKELQGKFLRELMIYNNFDVNLHAATEAVRQNILKEEAIKVIKKISAIEDEEYRFTRFHARIFLEEILPHL